MSKEKANIDPKGTSKNKDKLSEKEEVGGLGNVVVRNEFYRDGYRNLLRLTVLQSLTILGLVGAIYFVIETNQPENRYFATTEDGRLVPMVPLSQPNLSSPALMSWAAQTATKVMTFQFNDYRPRLQESSRNFTRRGWESFTVALQKSRIIEMVDAKQQIVSAAPAGAPVLQDEGEVAGRYQWIVDLPLVVTYTAGENKTNTNLLVKLVIVRVPRLETPNGVGIEQWIAVPR